MSEKIFNKLVRDKIPEIIKSNGGNPNFYILNNEEYIKKLKDKLIEECTEVINAENKKDITEELADVSEVMRCIAKEYGISLEEIEKSKIDKNEKRGGFDSKVFLVSTNLVKNF